MRLAKLVVIALTAMSAQAQAQAQVNSSLPKLAPQVCHVQFEKIDKGENPWMRLSFAKEFDGNIKAAEISGIAGAFDELEVLPEIRSYLNDGVAGFALTKKTGAQVQKEALESLRNSYSFETVRAGSGVAVARYSNSWVNAELGIVKLEVCRAK